MRKQIIEKSVADKQMILSWDSGKTGSKKTRTVIYNTRHTHILHYN